MTEEEIKLIYDYHRSVTLFKDEENKEFDPTKWEYEGGLNKTALKEITEIFKAYRRDENKDWNKLIASLNKYKDINGQLPASIRSDLDVISYKETGTFPTTK